MTAPPSEPMYFGPDGRPLFGWIHRPAPDRARGVGVVIVGPFGYEALCTHRSLRHLAEACAAAGHPTLRFDHDGTGDAAGDDRDPDRVDAWIASVGHAIEALRRHAGVTRLVIVGVRLGALLAARAAASRTDVIGFAAIAPVVSGRLYVRELRALQLALGLAAPPAGTPEEPEVQEAIGFAITAETRTALSAIDLAKDDRAPAPSILILDRDDLPAADRWAARLTELGASVDLQRLPGYVEMVLDPHKAVVPTAIIAELASWLAERARTATVASAGAAEPTSRSAAMAADVRETAMTVDAASGLFGILSAPTTATRTGRAIVLLNAGSIHHVGPNRLYVALARRWARRGDLVLRLDVSGIGDSPPRPGEPENVVYSARALDDVAAAIAALHRQSGVTEVRAIGLCSGAYHAFKAAVAGQRLTGVVPINPLTFFWKPGASLDFPRYRVGSDGDRYTRSVFDPAKWGKLMRGEVHVGTVAQTMGRYAAARLTDRARDLSRRVGMPWKEDLGAELEAVVRRKIDLRFVFATDDPGIALLRSQGGSVVPQLLARDQLALDLVDGPDHTFTPLWSHPVLARLLDAALDRPPR